MNSAALNNKSLNPWALVLVFLLCLVCFLVIVGLIAFPNISTIVYQSCNKLPDTSEDYCVSVIKESKPFYSSSFYIFAGSASDKKYHPTYGHFVQIPWLSLDPEEDLKASSAEWTTDGVTLILKSGHKVFIPQAYYSQAN